MKKSVAIVISGSLIALAIVFAGIYRSNIPNSTELLESDWDGSLSELSIAIGEVADKAFQTADELTEQARTLQVAGIGYELRVISCVVDNLDGRSVNDVQQSCQDSLESNTNNEQQ
ncbi:MAG: hypothetical protein EXR84_02875 [Gammaproteobacteria bacterium]|nr:hypothetical protein [Gammaproteobacteria bacterium]